MAQLIVDGILNLFYAILSPVIGFLPDGEFPIDPSLGQGFIGPLAKLDYLFPFLEPMRWLVSIVLSTMTAFLAYRVGLFIYTKIRG